MIRLATKSDLNDVLSITKACASKMITENIYQWNESYPDRATFEKDIKHKNLYVFEEEKKILGCIVISLEMDSEYKDLNWLTPNDQNYYVHRLAVHPNFQGQGIAKKLMNFALELAKKNRMLSIRLDTFSGNAKNQMFYESLNYISVGRIYYPNQSQLPFICFELILNENCLCQI